MTREQHIAVGTVIAELCNPDASLTERSLVAHELRKAFSLPLDHKDGCASKDTELDPEDIGYVCDCGFWDAIYPVDSQPATA